MVITTELYNEMQRLHRAGVSQRKIAATLHLSRNTVQKYLGGALPGQRAPYARKPPVLTPEVTAFIEKCLAEEVRPTAKAIYDRLVAECGFTGAESTVRGQVCALRKARAGNEKGK